MVLPGYSVSRAAGCTRDSVLLRAVGYRHGHSDFDDVPEFAVGVLMGAIALKSTKWALDIATKLIKANIRIHNIEQIKDDMAIVYVVNHFTRLETILLPYILHKYTGKEIWSLAAAELFVGKIG